MRLTFLGTRGNIRMASALHRYHSSLLVVTEGARVLVDAGDDWRGRLAALAPDAILVTHAHTDHAGALADGAPCPVYATAATHELLARYPLERRVVAPGERQRVGRLAVTAHQATHSLRAPAVGYRLERGRSRVFYVPDVLELVDPADALRGVRLYAGDGATHGRRIVQRRGGEAVGHATIEAQLEWCSAYGVPEAVFTHCGSRIVRIRPEEAAALVKRLGEERGVAAGVAVDGMVIRV
ncbi:MAG: MBL fold metallo-hydrolase [Coriobacteriia bacterium]|nr:MBL fold metallo-hydrolase [Coriobacteriia bacterium]